MLLAGFESTDSVSERPLGSAFLALVGPKYNSELRFWGSNETHKFTGMRGPTTQAPPLHQGRDSFWGGNVFTYPQ